MRIVLSLSILFCLIPRYINAEDHVFETYGVEQGLMHLYVYSISQDSSGFLWIGTNDGAFRFDGIEFDYYTMDQGLSENFISKVFTDSKGRVWFGHQSGKVSLLQDGKFTPFVLDSKLHGAVMDFHEDEKGRIWMLVQNLGLIKLDKDLNQQIFKFATNDPTLSCINSLGNDLFLLGTHEQLYLGTVDEASSTFINTSEVSLYPNSKVSDIITLFDGSYIIVSQDEGIFNLVMDKNSGLYILNNLNANEDGSLNNLQEGILLDNGDLILSSMGSGIIRFSENASGKYVLSEKVNTRNGLKSDNVKSIYQDVQGNLWCGLYGEGLSRKVNNNFSFYKYTDNGPGNVFAISEHQEGMLVGIDENISILNEKGEILRSLFLPEYLKQDRLNSLFRAPNGMYYLGFEKNGLYHLAGPNMELRKIQLSGNILSNSINHITGDEEFLWISTKHGLCRIDMKSEKKKWYTTNDGLPYNSIQAAFIDSKKRVLLSTIASYLPYIDPEGELQKIGKTSNGALVAITSVFEDSRGYIWLSTEGEGLLILNEDGFASIKEESGLYSNYCYTISESNEGKLLIGHRGAMSELDTNIEDIKIYGIKDGISNSTEFYPGAIYTNARKNTWFGTSNGLIQRNAAYDETLDTPPKLNIKAIYIDGETQLLNDAPYHLKTGIYEIRIEYSGINFQDAEGLSYQTMLEGYSTKWSALSKQRQVSYERVNHGNYKFHLKAFTSSGQSNELISTDLFIIEKPFYLRVWFYVLILTLISSLFYLAIIISRKKLKNEQNMLLERLDEKSKEIIIKEEIIKERKRVEEVLLEAKTKAETSEKLKTAFLRNMSHEIRTPMNAILGFSNILMTDEIPRAKRNDYLDVINKNSLSLLKLIDDIIDVSILEANQLKLKTKKCDLRKVMNSLESNTKTLLEKAKKDNINLIVSIPEEEDHFIDTDELRFTQVFKNLLDNSVKFTETGSIRFGYSFENENINFFVEDTGIGMSNDKFEVIFDLFRKETESNAQLYRGTGLGLTIAQLITNLLGGNISIDSECKKGSVFSFTLPRKASKTTLLHSENPFLADKGKWSDKKILIVEDTDSNYLLLENILKHTEVTIDRAEDGETALVKYSEGTYDLIIMDIKLPGMDGYEATRRIRKKDKQINIIAYTAYAMEYDKEKILKKGFNDYIPKPSSNDTITKLITTYLEGRKIDLSYHS